MGANLSTPEKIAKCCRAGDATSLSVRGGRAGQVPAMRLPGGLHLAAAAAPPSVHNCRPLESSLPPPCRSPQALLADLQRNDAGFRANRARYLEFTDENGNTPLTLAAARGHLGCVKLVSRDDMLPLRLCAAAHVAVVRQCVWP